MNAGTVEWRGPLPLVGRCICCAAEAVGAWVAWDGGTYVLGADWPYSCSACGASWGPCENWARDAWLTEERR